MQGRTFGVGDPDAIVARSCSCGLVLSPNVWNACEEGGSAEIVTTGQRYIFQVVSDDVSDVSDESLVP